MIGIGLDLVDLDRFARSLQRTPSLAARLFTDGERVVADRSDPVHGLAARFAAKEALMKAFGVGLGAFRFHDAEIVRHESGRPEFVLTGAAAALAEAHAVQRVLVTMSHTAHTAAAVVVLL